MRVSSGDSVIEENGVEGRSMLDVEEQVRRGNLVCPETHQKLVYSEGYLVTVDGRKRYPVVEGVPIFLPEAQRKEMLAQHDGSMHHEYTGVGRRDLGSVVDSLFSFFGDQRSRESARLSGVSGWTSVR